jgi:hypothetical protein
MIYSPDIAFSTGFLSIITDFFAQLFTVFRTPKSTYDVFNFTGNDTHKAFDKIYMMEKGNKNVTGIAGLVEPGGDITPENRYYIAVKYMGFTEDICDAVNAIDISSLTDVDISCSSNFVKIDTLGINKDFFEPYWVELTARIRP